MLKYFKETYPQNKNEIVALLNDNYRIIKDEAKRLGSGKKDPVVLLFKAFIDKVKRSQLPKCDGWWCFDFEVDSFGVHLFMCTAATGLQMVLTPLRLLSLKCTNLYQ